MELLFNHEPVHRLALPRYYRPSATLHPNPSKIGPPARPEPISEEKAQEEGAEETDVRFLIWYLREFLLEDRDRPELFSQGDTVCVLSFSSLPLARVRSVGTGGLIVPANLVLLSTDPPPRSPALAVARGFSS